MKIKYTGGRTHKKVCIGRSRYIFSRDNGKVCEVENPQHIKLFMSAEFGMGQYLITEQAKAEQSPTEIAPEEYRCKECKKIFKSYAGLKAHQARSHQPVKGKTKKRKK